MAENNLYELLGLPVEKYECDPAILGPILEKVIKDWKLSKDVRKQDQAAIYQVSIRAAIQDPVQWRQIYDEYRLRIEKSILLVASLIASENEISTDQIKKICDKYKVSYEYAESIISEEGYLIIDLSNYSIHSLEIPQKSRAQIKGIQNHIEVLGYSDIIAFIDDQLGEIISLTDVDNFKIIEMLALIKKRWSHTSYDGYNRVIRRSYIERICVGMTVFLKNNSLDDYFNFLMYDRINIILKKILTTIKEFEVSEINGNAYTNIVQEISKHTRDIQKAKCIFRAFLDENNIRFNPESA